ncbi:MAG: gliding motility-associated C-terminal domain-containing protein [Saprospiraceae bacterium]|nr:gliding motility-associated C-terminal domain-containing protein [Saprospiraceae bacterium]
MIRLYIIFMFLNFYHNILLSQQNPCIQYKDTNLCFIKTILGNSSLEFERKIESIQDLRVYFTPLLADVDGDCIPDLVMNSFRSDSVLFIDSRSGQTKGGFKKYVSFNDFNYLLILDIDQDLVPEFITHTVTYTGDTSYYGDRLVCYKMDGTLLWVSDKRINLTPINGSGTGTIGAADFNQDGVPEIYVSNKIFNARTGVQLADGGLNGRGYNIPRNQDRAIAVAANLDIDTTDLELVAGYTIYKVKISNLNGMTGNRMTPYNIQINGQFEDGVTSVADIDQNGILDVIVSVQGFDSDPLVYTYYLNNGIPSLLATANPAANPNSGLRSRSITLPTIGKINFGQSATIIISVDSKMYAYFYDGTNKLREKWTLTHTDSSGSAEITLFDFNGDGINEIVFRDETHIRLIDGSASAPRVIHQLPCFSPTYTEYPIIGDLDNTGEAKFCVTCALSERSGGYSKLTIFGPLEGQHWAPARGVWNQYPYNPLFINDDLTVPQYQKNHATYMNGRYNNFMQQESLLDENGYYKKPAASLTGLIHCVDYDPVTDSFTVRFELHNRNDASRIADVDLPVSFYGANPELDTALLGVYLTTEIIKPGDSLRDLIFRFSASDLTRIYLVVNTRRNSTGPFDSTHFDQPECDYTDNFYYLIDLPKIQRDTVSICEGSTYIFYDTVLYDAGKYHRSLKNQKGCDSLIVLLDLALSNIVRTQTALSACEIYDWHGKIITQTGIYSDSSITSGGCDSIATLDLRIHPSVSQTQTISACDAFDWNGQTYTQSGQYVFNGQTENGCDSTVTLDLIIHPSSHSMHRMATCDTFQWNGNVYTQSGIYEFKTQNSVGCDSTAILDLTIDSVIRQQISHTSCDRYLWNGQTLTQSGTYTHQDISQAGCDSIVTLDLKLLQSTNSNSKINACDQYTWNGNNYTQSGTYQHSATNADGCDSIATLELTILSSSSSMSQISNCAAYLWNGNNYTQSGIYEFKALNSLGCDSTAILELIILPIHQNNIQESACDKYNWNGITYDQSGNYSFNTKNQFGCDSSIILELEILKSSSANISLSTCDSLVFHGQTLTESGSYPFTIRNAAGCDSVIILNLSINSNQQISSVSSCDPYRWDVDGQNYTQSGRYLMTFTNAQGCDSVHILDFRRLPFHLINEKAEVCGPFYWNVTNTLLNQSGNYCHPLQTFEGCDSLLNLELIIHPHFIKTDTIISQTDYNWPVNNTNYSASGNFEEKYSSEFGCDSIHRLILIIKNEQGIYYPNVLIPGGISGGFTIFDNLYTIASITTLSIYDRWGSLVWQKHNFAPNDPTLGWDGRFKGQHVVPGVYTWHAQLTLKDGTYQTVKGDLTVVR